MEETQNADSAAKKVVLVVDDNEAAAEALASALSYLGYEAHTVYESALVLEAALQYMPDLILLDIGMPFLDGYEIARKIREKLSLSGVKIVAVTGYGSEEDRKKGREAGFDMYLVKPISIGDLERLLAEINVKPFSHR